MTLSSLSMAQYETCRSGINQRTKQDPEPCISLKVRIGMKPGSRSSKRLMQKHMEILMLSDGAFQGMPESDIIASVILSCNK